MTLTANYIDVAEVDWTGTTLTEAQKQTLISEKEGLLERVCHDVFYELTETVKFDGNGRDRLPLHNRPALLSITGIRLGVSELVTLASSGYKFAADCIYRVGGGTWPVGFRNVEIAGTWGWSEVPVLIKKAALILLDAELHPDKWEFVDFEREEAGDMKQGRPLYKRLTGVVEADKILSRYRRTSFSARKI